MKKKSIFFSLFLFSVLALQAQIGVNTESPISPLEVVSSTSATTGKAFLTSTSDGNESMQVRNDGYIGLGATNPLVKLDLRANNLAQENAIGIGYTGLTAEAAEAGAIRYEPTLKVLQYSDGEVWLTLQDNPAKLIIIASNSSQQQFITDNLVSSGRLVNWTVDYTNEATAFNAQEGYFIAPRDGVYSVSATAVLIAETMAQGGGQYELNFQHVYFTASKSVVALLTKVEPISLTNTGQALFKMSAGDIVALSLYMTMVVDPKLSADGSLTTLTIAEM